MASDSQRARPCTNTEGSRPTSADRLPQLVGHARLLVGGELWEERQREDLARGLLGHRERPRALAEMLERPLQVDGNRIVNPRADAGRVELLQGLVATGLADGFQVPAV